MDVLCLKMSNGDELIAEFVNEEKTDVVIKRPRVLQGYQTERGFQMGLIPWFISSPDETFVVSKNHIVASKEAPADISKAYMQQVSGIQLASSLMEG